MHAKSLFIAAAVLAATAAHGTPSFLHTTPYTPSQSGNDIRLGVAVEGRTAWHTLTVGAGMTVTCEGVTVQINAERVLTTSSIFGDLQLVVTAPQTVPSNYNIPGWQSLADNTCRQCSFLYKGSAVDGSANISASGLGGNFSFDVGGAISETNTILFNVCRGTTNCDGGGSNPSRK